jgi:hypothetical protein
MSVADCGRPTWFIPLAVKVAVEICAPLATLLYAIVNSPGVILPR